MTNLERILPLVGTLRDYKREDLRGDVSAGLTTAVMLIPQGMAYAVLAGLPPLTGLYSALIPPLIYALFGTSRQMSVGPVAMDSLLVGVSVGAVAQSGTSEYLSAALLLAFMVGVIQLLFGLLRMGFLANLLSGPVVSGFTSAAALIIGLSQIKHLLGISVEESSNVVSLIGRIVHALPETRMETLAIGAGALLGLLLFKKFAPRAPAALLVVSAGACLVYFGGLAGSVAVVGEVPAGLPGFQPPMVEGKMILSLLPSALTIALVGFIESFSISRTHARKNKYTVVPSQELVALGAANLFGSFFHSYPVAGGFSRSAVNASAGAKTNLAALVTSGLVAFSLLFLTPLFYYLPLAALAAIILIAVAGLVDFAEVRRLERINRADLVLLLGTFALTLTMGIVQGIAIGILASLAWLVFKTTRPHIAVLGRVPGTTQFRSMARNAGLITYHGVIAVRMDAQFYFGNIAFLKNKLAELETTMEEALRVVVLDASAINNLDSSGESALRDMNEAYEARDVAFYLTGVKGPVRDVMEMSGLSDTLGARCRHPTVLSAIVACGAEAKVRSSDQSIESRDAGSAETSSASARL